MSKTAIDLEKAARVLCSRDAFNMIGPDDITALEWDDDGKPTKHGPSWMAYIKDAEAVINACGVKERLEKAEELLDVHFKKLWEDDLNVENVCGATLAFCGRCEDDGGSILGRAATWKDVPHSEKCIYAPARAFLTEQSQ